ncbi:alpha-tocopherol transfer protein-like isoform X1 [Planococcus citri]|uniref:alpha-tocopherol transfer protein-like isoform X1 n=1 Tax=Planococcus citri TaxID=170843 RepID=UPI0031FA2990
MATQLDKYFSDVKIPNSITKADIKSIKDWLSKQRHLPELSDRQIAIFIHSCFGALELTKNTIESYYTIRTHAPELFNGRNAKEVAETNNVIIATVLPDLSVEKDNLILAGFYDENPEKFNVQKAVRLFFSIWDLEGNLIPDATGWRVIISAKGFSLGHFTRITTNMGIVRKVICYLQDGLPLRLKGIHIFNAIPLVNQFLAVVKPIMKKELYQLIKVHPTNNIESLYDYVPKDSLPTNFGGKAPSLDELIKLSNEKMKKYEPWFADDEKLARVDESQRTGKPKNSGDIFGFDGSFKKLDFD